MSSLPPECQQLLVSGYVLGNLSSAEALLFQEMLAENPALIEQVRAMQQALDNTYQPPEIAPPANLRDRLLATAKTQAVEAVDTQATPTPTESPKIDERLNSRAKLSPILGAALLTIAFLGFNNYRFWRMANNTEVVTAANQRTYLLQGEAPSATARAKLIVDSERLNATLIASNLPPLPPEKAYALWTVVGRDVPYTTDDKGAILTAVFQVDAVGNFTRDIALPQPHLEPKTIQKLAITIEDVSAPQAHTGSIFISTQ